jgi:glyoxylase-like metal-dependent hydrolase (beta-lactamase superfamily II)
MKFYIFQVGQVRFPDRSILTGGPKEGKEIIIPVPAFLIVHQKGLAIVDTGMNLDNWPPKNREDGEMKPEQRIDRQLLNLGYKPEGVKYVIMSHLHADHAGWMTLFPHAAFIVRKAELKAAWWPEIFQWSYSFADYSGTRSFKFVQLDDVEDFDVFLDGSVLCVDTKGHCQGHQSVILNLPVTGKIVIAGDAVPMAEIIDEGTLPGVAWNGEAAMRAVSKMQHLKREGAFVLLGHDPDQFRTLKLAPDYYE